MAWQPAPIGAGKHAEMLQTALQHPKERVESQPDLTLTNSMLDQTSDHRSFARGSRCTEFGHVSGHATGRLEEDSSADDAKAFRLCGGIGATSGCMQWTSWTRKRRQELRMDCVAARDPPLPTRVATAGDLCLGCRSKSVLNWAQGEQISFHGAGSNRPNVRLSSEFTMNGKVVP